MGDFNAKIGCDIPVKGVTGKHGLAECNERGQRLIDFCIDNKLTITNTVYQHHPRRKYTWISPDGNTLNQIDYILIDNRWKTSILNSHCFAGADCGSDHQLLAVSLSIRLKRMKKNTSTVTRFDLQNLSTGEYEMEIRNRFSILAGAFEDLAPDDKWEKVK